MTNPTKTAITFTLIVGLGVILLGYLGAVYHPETSIKPPSKPVERQRTFEDLLDAIEWVESKGNPNAVGDGGLAVGCMQIHPIMVRDVNRILGWDGYTLDDRYDRYKSYQMFRIYIYHYCKDKDFEYMARCWNGGPTGWKKDCTIKYWEKVKKAIEGE